MGLEQQPTRLQPFKLASRVIEYVNEVLDEVLLLRLLMETGFPCWLLVNYDVFIGVEWLSERDEN